jgi:(p)ppGpp synthase/HD superfamily hydrolase
VTDDASESVRMEKIDDASVDRVEEAVAPSSDVEEQPGAEAEPPSAAADATSGEVEAAPSTDLATIETADEVVPALAAEAPRSPGRERSSRARATTRLGGSFSEAVVYTKILHGGRTRRGTAVPYLGHLLATAALVLEDGGSEAEAIAALLHDAVEDGIPGTADAIRAQFGTEVADIVLGCTDPDVPGGFRVAKVEHLRELERGSTSVRRVALAEKLDNARALLRDLERYGADTWKRMEVDRDEMLWYLRSLVAVFDRAFPSVLADELRRVVEQIEAHAA